MTPFGDLFLGGVGTHFASVTYDRQKADSDATVPERLNKHIPPDDMLREMVPSTSQPAADTGSETASTHTVAGTYTLSPKTSTASTSEAEAEDANPAPAETSTPHPSTFDLPVRTGSNSDTRPAEDSSVTSHTDKENKRKASASERDTTPHKKAAPSDAWLDEEKIDLR
jgi:hypothetical protein